MGLPINLLALDIDREWGRDPGWFMGLDADTQHDLLAERILMLDPRSRVMGVHPSLLSSQMTPTAAFHLVKMFLGKGDDDSEPLTVDDFAKAQGWV